MHVALVFLRRPDDDGVGPQAIEAHRQLNDNVGLARTLTNAGIEAYFRGQWTEAAERYLEALESAQRAGSIVPAATAAINSAEILCDQGEWDRALGLFDGAVRNYEAVGYQPGIGAANLFSAVAAMRSGRLDDAARRLDVAEALLTDLAMTEWLDDLATRRSELALLRTEHDADRSSDELLAGSTRITPFAVAPSGRRVWPNVSAAASTPVSSRSLPRSTSRRIRPSNERSRSRPSRGSPRMPNRPNGRDRRQPRSTNASACGDRHR